MSPDSIYKTEMFLFNLEYLEPALYLKIHKY